MTDKSPPGSPPQPPTEPDVRTPVSQKPISGTADALPEIPGFEIVERLGRGGMGEVYKARDSHLERTVAIKLMAAELSGDELDARFRREAQAAASISHPNVAHVYSAGTALERQYFVMEYVEGQSLADVMRREGRLTGFRCLRYLRQACLGLRAARAAGVIHRDIKPSNLMLDGTGNLKIVDFGLARRPKVDHTLTRQNSVMGTPDYMAPEQALGQGVDHRADIYALGATFYHLLSGRPPFEADTPLQVLMHHTSAPLPSLKERNPALPADVCALIEKMLAKDPANRFQDYDSLLSAIDARLQPASGADSGTRPSPAATHRRSSPLLVIIGLLTATVVIAIFYLGGRTKASGQSTTSPNAATSAPPAAPEPRDPAPRHPPRPLAPPPEEGQRTEPQPARRPEGAEVFVPPAPVPEFKSPGTPGPGAAIPRSTSQAPTGDDPRTVTERSMRALDAALTSYMESHTRPPSDATALAAASNLDSSLTRDGWGNTIVIINPPLLRPQLVSPGPDGQMRTADDLLFLDGTLRTPPLFDPAEKGPRPPRRRGLQGPGQRGNSGPGY